MVKNFLEILPAYQTLNLHVPRIFYSHWSWIELPSHGQGRTRFLEIDNFPLICHYAAFVEMVHFLFVTIFHLIQI